MEFFQFFGKATNFIEICYLDLKVLSNETSKLISFVHIYIEIQTDDS
jgi:hypothetical protein